MSQPSQCPEILTDVGGPVDEIRVVLAVYGEALDPDVVSRQLGCIPSSAHRRGEKRGPRSRPYTRGAWFLEVEGRPPTTVDDLITTLLGQFPENPGFWQPLTASYDVQIRFGIHTKGWNRGFDVSARSVALLAMTRADLVFDLYMYGDEGDEVP